MNIFVLDNSNIIKENTGYFMPVVIYISLFFGYGIGKIINLKKIVKF